MPGPNEVMDAVYVAKNCLELILRHHNSIKSRHPEQIAVIVDLINTAVEPIIDGYAPDEPKESEGPEKPKMDSSAINGINWHRIRVLSGDEFAKELEKFFGGEK